MTKLQISLLVITLFIIAFSDKAPAHKLSEKEGADLIVIEKGDTISGICADRYAKKLLPSGMTTGRCMTAVLRKNLSEDMKVALAWAKQIRTGDNLFFPAKSRAEYEEFWLAKIDRSIKDKISANEKFAVLNKKHSETVNILGKAEMDLAWWKITMTLMVMGGAALILLALWMVYGRGERRSGKNKKTSREDELEKSVTALHAELSKWKPGSPVIYAYDDPELGSAEIVFKNIGSKLKRSGKGIEVPCGIWQSPYDMSSVDTYPAENIRSHVKENLKKRKQEEESAKMASL